MQVDKSNRVPSSSSGDLAEGTDEKLITNYPPTERPTAYIEDWSYTRGPIDINSQRGDGA